MRAIYPNIQLITATLGGGVSGVDQAALLAGRLAQ